MAGKLRNGFKHRKRGHFKRRATHIPQAMRLTNPRRPLASKYGDELFVKIQYVGTLRVSDNFGNCYAYMRQDIPVTTSEQNIALYNQPEFVPFLPLYGFYEVRGMKAEMTVKPTAQIVGAGLYAGMANGLPNPPTAPDILDLVKLPIQTKGNVQGEMFSIYYGFSDDLK